MYIYIYIYILYNNTIYLLNIFIYIILNTYITITQSIQYTTYKERYARNNHVIIILLLLKCVPIARFITLPPHPTLPTTLTPSLSIS